MNGSHAGENQSSEENGKIKLDVNELIRLLGLREESWEQFKKDNLEK